MTIGLKTKGSVTEIGPGSILHSFCSTVAVRLEDGHWGSRFPLLQNALYGDGRLPVALMSQLLEELDTVREALSGRPASEIVHDIEHRDAQPAPIRADRPATDLASCFVTKAGRGLIDVLEECCNLARAADHELVIVSYRRNPGDL